MLTYSRYATSGTNGWVIYFILSFVPVLNVLYSMSNVLSPIKWVTNDYHPLSDANNVKSKYNMKVQCKECDVKFYMWQGVHEVKEYYNVIHCPQCDKRESIVSLENQQENVEGEKLSMRGAVAFNRILNKASLEIHKDQLNTGGNQI